MLCLSKLYDSYLWPEVCFFRSVFTHLQGLQPPFRQSSESTRPPPSLRTMPQIPGLSSQQKGKERLLRPSDCFHSRIWKCFKNVKYGAWTKNPNYLSLSFFLSFPFSSVAPLLLSPLLNFRRGKIPIPSVIQRATPFRELEGFPGFYGWGELARVKRFLAARHRAERGPALLPQSSGRGG